MNESHWTNALAKATWTLLFTAVGAFVAWQLFSDLVPVLIVIAVLLFIYRLALGTWQRRHW